MTGPRESSTTLTSQDLFAFRGAAANMAVPWLNATMFYSRNARNGILNPDGTINYYAYTDPVMPSNQNNFNEQNAGGTARIDLAKRLVLAQDLRRAEWPLLRL